MEIVKIVMLALTAAMFALTIRSKQPEMAMQISIICGLVIFIYIVNYLSVSVKFINDMLSTYNISSDSFGIVLKIIGISYICEFAVQILKDAGESSVAARVELAGRVLIVVMTLPMLKAFLSMISGLL